MQGQIVVSQSLDETARIFMNVNEVLRIELTESQLGYMENHHKNLI